MFLMMKLNGVFFILQSKLRKNTSILQKHKAGIKKIHK